MIIIIYLAKYDFLRNAKSNRRSHIEGLEKIKAGRMQNFTQISDISQQIILQCGLSQNDVWNG